MPNLRSTSKSRGRNSADTLRSLLATAKRKERSSRSADGSNSANDPPSKGIAGSSPIKSPAKSKSRTPDASQQATPPSIRHGKGEFPIGRKEDIVQDIHTDPNNPAPAPGLRLQKPTDDEAIAGLTGDREPDVPSDAESARSPLASKQLFSAMAGTDPSPPPNTGGTPNTTIADPTSIPLPDDEDDVKPPAKPDPEAAPSDLSELSGSAAGSKQGSVMATESYDERQELANGFWSGRAVVNSYVSSSPRPSLLSPQRDTISSALHRSISLSVRRSLFPRSYRLSLQCNTTIPALRPAPEPPPDEESCCGRHDYL